ncbi:MAG: hypothetical protein GF411_15660 [Candidatus Lokiarchaeota archaeon]|nr:hypothetical protein [Candidatus Lokiarchaeota archaeon]
MSRLRSVANNAVRGSVWSHEPTGDDPFRYHDIPFKIVVDLLTGVITPDMEGDSVEEFYTAITRWFHDVLKKEGIPIEVIESATITLKPGGYKVCEIIAQGRRFVSFPEKGN